MDLIYSKIFEVLAVLEILWMMIFGEEEEDEPGRLGDCVFRPKR